MSPSALDEAATSLLAEAEALTDRHPPARLRSATGAFLDALRRRREPVPAFLLEALSTLPPLGAAWLAITFGSAVEQGLPPASTAGAIVALLRRWLDSYARNDDNDDDDALSPAIVAAFPWLGQSLVAHLARFPERRAELAADTRLLEQLVVAGRQTHGATWVHELLLRRSGPLIVLHVESRRGLALRYENVGRCFHLFTLVQGAIGTRLPGGREPGDALVEAAMGGEYTSRSDSAWWHYQDHTASEAHFMNSLWAEWSVGDMPEIDGTRVLVLWPPILGGRHWGADFFGPPLEAAPPLVTIERELDRDEAEAWLERLGISTTRAKG